MDNDIDVTFQAEALPLGETMRGECPECGSHEKFYITHMDDGQFAYICHRASCATKGYAGGGGAPVSAERPLRQYTPFRGEMNNANAAHEDLLHDRFPLLEFIDPYLVRIADVHYWALRVQGPMREHRGWVIRKPWWPCRVNTKEFSHLAKARTYREDGDGPMIAWYANPVHNSGTVIVEDQMSALIVSQNTRYSAVALLGTIFNTERAREIQKHGSREIILALDADVTSHAFDIARRFGSAFRDFRVALIERDIKDMTAGELGGVFT